MLTSEEQAALLRFAREAIEHGVRGQKLPKLDQRLLTPTLRAPGASFVTLTIDEMLRGCIGTLDAYQSLAEDVREHARAAALEDPRFPPLREQELDEVKIEVSRLTPPQPLEYTSAEELLQKLHPHVDGVILKSGHQRATFLPQVWEKIQKPADFLDGLCEKMGVRPGFWRDTKLQVYVYQVEEFHELN